MHPTDAAMGPGKRPDGSQRLLSDARWPTPAIVVDFAACTELNRMHPTISPRTTPGWAWEPSTTTARLALARHQLLNRRPPISARSRDVMPPAKKKLPCAAVPPPLRQPQQRLWFRLPSPKHLAAELADSHAPAKKHAEESCWAIW